MAELEFPPVEEERDIILHADKDPENMTTYK